MKLPTADYQAALLELSHLRSLRGWLMMEEQRTAGILGNKRTSHDIHAMAQLPRIRKDIASVSGVMQVMENLINGHIQDTYAFKFESFKVKDYAETIAAAKQVAEQIQEQEGDSNGPQIRQSEGSDTRADAGTNEGRVVSLHEGKGSPVPGTDETDSKPDPNR